MTQAPTTTFDQRSSRVAERHDDWSLARSVAAELLVMRKRVGNWVLLGIWLILAIFFGYVVPYLTYRNAGTGAAPGALQQLLPQSLVGNMSAGFPFYGGALVLMLGVLSLGSEYGWDTVKTLFTQRPARLQLFGAKLIALGLALIPFVVLVFLVGLISSLVIAQLEGVAIVLPDIWLVARGLLAGWFILAVWAAFGVMLAVLSRGTALAIGIGILYALVIEGLLSAFANEVSLLKPIVTFFLRANAYSLVRPLNDVVARSANGGPGAFAGPYVSAGQAMLVLGIYLAVFLLVAGLVIRRRDVSG